jgi:hypothetical protein
MLRASLGWPLSCAFPASLKPGAYIELRNPCCAQALGDRPWSPVQRMRWTLVRPSDTCVAPFATRRTHAFDPWRLREKLSALSPATLRPRRYAVHASLWTSQDIRVLALATVLLAPVPAFVACNSPCFARKAGDFQSLENSARRIRLARVFHAPAHKFWCPAGRNA